MVMGTPQYLSPEQALGKAVDHRSDLYATGCLLYELLALRPPFIGETPLSVVYQHVQDAPVPPSRMQPARAARELDGLVLALAGEEPGRPLPERRGDARAPATRCAQMHGATGGGYGGGAAGAAGGRRSGRRGRRPRASRARRHRRAARR